MLIVRHRAYHYHRAANWVIGPQSIYQYAVLMRAQQKVGNQKTVFTHERQAYRQAKCALKP